MTGKYKYVVLSIARFVEIFLRFLEFLEFQNLQNVISESSLYWSRIWLLDSGRAFQISKSWGFCPGGEGGGYPDTINILILYSPEDYLLLQTTCVNTKVLVRTFDALGHFISG